MSLRGPFAVGDLNQALICFDETSTEIHRWLCRIGSSRDAPTLLSSTYTNALASQARDSSVIDEVWLMAEGVRLAAAKELLSESIGAVSPVHRALLDLALIRELPLETVARIAAIPSAEVGDALLGAQRLFEERCAGVALDDFCAPMKHGSTTIRVERAVSTWQIRNVRNTSGNDLHPRAGRRERGGRSMVIEVRG